MTAQTMSDQKVPQDHMSRHNLFKNKSAHFNEHDSVHDSIFDYIRDSIHDSILL